MVDKKTIGYSVLSGIIGLLVMLGGVQLTDDNVYYCEDRGLVMSCDQLTVYYGLDNGKCWNEAGNKLCRTGWLLIEDDSEFKALEEEPKTSHQEICNVDGCVPKED